MPPRRQRLTVLAGAVVLAATGCAAQATDPTSTTPPPTTTHTARAGVILPDRALTPGAVDPHITQANIGTTICLPGYTKTVRPPTSYTTPIEQQMLTNGYTYRSDTDPTHYELDHLIPLAVGGAPRDPANLWPQPYEAGTGGARVKDRLEVRLRDLVCSGELRLRTAQDAVAENWWTAYTTYVEE